MGPSRSRATRIVKVHPTKRSTRRPDLNLQTFRGKTVQALSFTNVCLGSSAGADSFLVGRRSNALVDATFTRNSASQTLNPLTSQTSGSHARSRGESP